VRSEIDRYVGPGGRVLWLRWQVAPWRKASGEVGGVMIAVENLSDVVHAGERLRNIVEAMPNAVLMVDLSGAITLVNAETERLLGWSRGELVGRSVDLLLPAASRERHVSHRAGFFAQPDRRSMGRGRDLFAVHKDGHPIAVEVGLNPVTLPEGAFVLAAVVDVTERRRLQDELRRANGELEDRVAQRTAELARALDAAQAATRAKSAFLANMSHELRTPMNAIMGFTSLLANEAREPRQRARLGQIEAASKHLLHIINEVLDLSKIEAGKMRLNAAEFSLDELAARTLELVTVQARAKELELVLDIDQAPALLVGDATRLSQALINLLSNAVKFTAAGWVCLRVTQDERDGARCRLRFEVSDTGMGIAPEVLSRLFSAFEQADMSTSRQHGGTGLGLALTRHIAELHGGEVGVDSLQGSGSRFWFTAWLTAVAAADREPPERKRVLLAHPLEVARSAIAGQLQRAGLVVDVHPEAPGAFDLARVRQLAGAPYDLLVLAPPADTPGPMADIHAPRRPLGTPGPRVIHLARYETEALDVRARAAGFDGVLVAPVTVQAVQALFPKRAGSGAPGFGSIHDTLDLQALKSRWTGRRILVVEDNPVNQEVALALLGMTGVRVDLAGNGQLAVDMVLDGDYDLVLMDVQMPIMDGMQAARAIRAVGLQLPIVAMTANAFTEERQACLDAGMNDHLGKPVDFVQLFAALEHWLPADQAAAR
jgi:PAS domain S-box-containing protein